MLASSTQESNVGDPWVTRMCNTPAKLVSTTLKGSLDWPDATIVAGDAVDVVALLKQAVQFLENRDDSPSVSLEELSTELRSYRQDEATPRCGLHGSALDGRGSSHYAHPSNCLATEAVMRIRTIRRSVLALGGTWSG